MKTVLLVTCEYNYYIIIHTMTGYTHNFISFSVISLGGPWAKSGQNIARMPDRLLRHFPYKHGRPS